jgi:hypothetical protein
MDFVCLDGSITSIDVKPSKYPTREVSKKQSAARERILKEYGDQIILEEFTIPKTRLRIDFFLPRAGIAIEVHGNQHFEFVKHFHGTKKKFLEAKQNDADKKTWCELNDIQLVVWKD